MCIFSSTQQLGSQNRFTMPALQDMNMTPVRWIKTDAIRTSLIAPCGMNCRLCYAYTRDKNACPGCRCDNSLKPKTRVTCRIKNCKKFKQGKTRYCSNCDMFPCVGLNHLDERYRIKYGMSMIDNLVHIKKFGIRHFIRREKEKWACPECGQLLCVHKQQCLFCGHMWR